MFLNRVAAGLPTTILGDGTSIRDYVYIDDVASALSALVLMHVECGVVNIGSGHGDTVIELLDVVKETVGRTPVALYAPRRLHDVDAIGLDISKLRSLIPYAPRPIGEGVRATWTALPSES